MGVYYSAGTYVQELDLSQVIIAFSTSAGAIVGDFVKGPINTPVNITGTTQFISVFGKPNLNTYPAAYCALAFLGRSTNLLVVRAASSLTPPVYAGLVLQQSVSGNATLSASNFTSSHSTVTNPSALNLQTVIAPGTSNTNNLAYFYNIGPGSSGNTVGISISSDNAAPATLSNVIGNTGTLAIGSYTYVVTAVKTIGNVPNQEILSNTSAANVTAIGEVTLTWTPTLGATSYNVYRQLATGPVQLLAQIPSGISSTFYNSTANTFSYSDTGAVNPATQYQNASGITVTYANGVTPTIAPAVSATTDVFTVNIFDSTISLNTPVESWTVSLDNSTSPQGQQQQIATVINTLSSYVNVIENPNYGTKVVYPIAFTYLLGGVDGAQPSVSDIAAAWTANFSSTEATTVRLMINGGVSDPSVQTVMDSIAQSRGDCVTILDVPTIYQKATDAVMYRNAILGLNSNRSALYSPDVYIDDIYNGGLVWVPPSGHVASVYAYNDYVANAWFAPAGLNRGLLSIRDVRYRYDQPDRDTLAKAQVNYLRYFPTEGIAVWEALTLQTKPSALSFVNVRRLMDVIEISLKTALLYQVWEPSDDFLRRQIVGMVTEFLTIIQNKRGIIAFTVVCDNTNNPPALTATGQLNVDVYITPTLPASKIQIQGIITQQNASFNELIASAA